MMGEALEQGCQQNLLLLWLWPGSAQETSLCDVFTIGTSAM